MNHENITQIPGCPPVTLSITKDTATATYTYQLVSFNDTWCYNVTVNVPPGSGLGLSHFVIAVCPDITAEDIVSVTVDFGSGPQSANFEFGNIKLFPPNNQPSIYGIKINQAMGNNQSAQFCINFVPGTGALLTPEPGELFMKAGSGPATPANTASSTDLCVPSCAPSRGIVLI